MKRMDKHQARDFGRYLADARAAQGLSGRQLAEKLEMHHGTLARIENGEFAAPAPDKLAAIAEAIGLPVADVFARAGYVSTQDLPDIAAYMRTKFKGLPEDAAQKIAKYARSIATQHGIGTDGPANKRAKPS